ncbi:MAG TPA: 16S rRNA (cytidine(1402)-2'-O)-methyltransferase [Alphaproteobacteria bacterium]|nr:16S rRNA (cytidine(1402)-2'-O)-methyltransferase [Alphaproteobacteria bacterium]
MLYLISTPIGNLKDITQRAIETLQKIDVLFCEDTRVSLKLLKAYSIEKKLVSFHDHNEQDRLDLVEELLSQGKKVGLISDAGTPLISDPGYKLIKRCQEKRLAYTHIPGPSSVISALLLSGQPSYAFSFLGFVDEKKLSPWSSCQSSLIFFEAPHRLLESLHLLKLYFPNRGVSVVREITKLYEECKKGTFEDVIAYYETNPPRGEICIVLGPPASLTHDYAEELKKLLISKSIKDASKMISDLYGVSKKEVYEKALEYKKA